MWWEAHYIGVIFKCGPKIYIFNKCILAFAISEIIFLNRDLIVTGTTVGTFHFKQKRNTEVWEIFKYVYCWFMNFETEKIDFKIIRQNYHKIMGSRSLKIVAKLKCMETVVRDKNYVDK